MRNYDKLRSKTCSFDVPVCESFNSALIGLEKRINENSSKRPAVEISALFLEDIKTVVNKQDY
ncbi:MAG: hypothetical protein LE169_03800 [Endomicrobium sp.]|nr:hypothetical protein [Endomicrobium sp.]